MGATLATGCMKHKPDLNGDSRTGLWCVLGTARANLGKQGTSQRSDLRNPETICRHGCPSQPGWLAKAQRAHMPVTLLQCKACYGHTGSQRGVHVYPEPCDHVTVTVQAKPHRAHWPPALLRVMLRPAQTGPVWCQSYSRRDVGLHTGVLGHPAAAQTIAHARHLSTAAAVQQEAPPCPAPLVVKARNGSTRDSRPCRCKS